MIKIKANKIEVVTQYDVEPKVVTLYYVNPLDKDIVEYKNCVFKEAKPVIYGASGANDYYLEYKNKELYLYVRVDITTGVVKDDSGYFFDETKAVSIHKKLRIELLRNRIDGLKDGVIRLKEYQKELEELENEKGHNE